VGSLGKLGCRKEGMGKKLVIFYDTTELMAERGGLN